MLKALLTRSLRMDGSKELEGQHHASSRTIAMMEYDVGDVNRSATVPLLGSSEDEEEIDVDLIHDRSRVISRGSIRCYLLVPLSLLLLGLFLRYIYSDPLDRSSSWKSRIYDSRSDISPIVHAAGRKYRGERKGNDEFVTFLGIQYGESPVGDLRFRKPVPIPLGPIKTAKEWEELEFTDALLGDPGCPRRDFADPTKMSFVGVEDCLRLNVYTPAKRVEGALLPVIFWIHGGGYGVGQGRDRNPRDLIHQSIKMNTPIVFVSINYRLGVLGMSASPPVPHFPLLSAPVELDLNVAFRDQLLALEWVNREISRFGGDPNQLTLAGNSAGAMSVGLHQLYSPPELFRAAFMMSGSPTSFPVLFPSDSASRTLHKIAGPASCPPPVATVEGSRPSNTLLIDCLRKLPLHDLMMASKVLSDSFGLNAYFPWYPVLEGDYEGSWLKVRPSEMIRRGTFAKIPIIMGSTKDEGTMLTRRDTKSQDDIINTLRVMFTSSFGSVETILAPLLDLYPNDPVLGSPYYTSNNLFGLDPFYKKAASMIGDLFFAAPIRYFMREMPKDFGTPSWGYSFDQPRPGDHEYVGVPHTSDLLAWMGQIYLPGEETQPFSQYLSAYLVNFATSLDPNGPGLRHWPQYGVDHKILHLSQGNITAGHDDQRTEAMSFIDKNNPIFDR